MTQENATETTRTEEVPIHKIWRKGRFCNITYWPKADKVIIDIGVFDDNSKKLTSSTKCYVDAFRLASYLYADIHGQLDRFYPNFTSEGVSYFGGSGNVSRVFKVDYWRSGAPGNQTVDTTARAFKCGHFEGSGTASGAIKPNMSKPISVDSVKLSQVELLEIYLALKYYWSKNPYASADES